jgi:Cyclin, N-terminal domain
LNVSSCASTSLIGYFSLKEVALKLSQVDGPGHISLTSANYQLVGSACFIIAAKICEIHPPKLALMVDVSIKAFTEEDLKVVSANSGTSI